MGVEGAGDLVARFQSAKTNQAQIDLQRTITAATGELPPGFDSGAGRGITPGPE